jgi:hypothetical protein
MTPTMMAAL